ncbi:insulinase family protein [Brevibacillus fluminis]|uniref:Insulinase family protein n=1 Tax=Brevibacillus fluminis TaxID=511487 RepID=A0A3M8DWC3_9BACL|nr:pitrilysin family protein [Brevibacillus fluminis]RNB91805.1 insulinase family protein [Brevibacillus fluminis]
MTASTKEILFETSHVNEMNLHILSTDKFKTTTIVLMIQQPLAEETVTKTALLSMVMKRATARFPETRLLREHLDFLYGAIFDVDVTKKGERQIVQVYMEIPNEKFLSEQTPLLEQAIQLVGEVVTQPYLENGKFAEKYVRTEKESLRKRIESLVDDKMRYANQRVTEEMCAGEPFGLLVYGRIADLAEIDGGVLHSHYQDLLAHYPIDIFVVGDVQAEQVKSYIQTYIKMNGRQVKAFTVKSTPKHVTNTREVIERLEVNQGKLNIGCRTKISYPDDDYPALLIANGVLGGFPHSKLFVNVREKESLAYYAVSRLESHKGILMIMSGIEVGNYQKALLIINEQLKLVQAGQISEQEMSQTKATLINQFRELLDSPRMMVDFTYNGIFSGRTRRLSELLDEINQITVDQVKAAAGKIQMDTIYLLRDQKGEA